MPQKYGDSVTNPQYFLILFEVVWKNFGPYISLYQGSRQLV